MTFVTPESRVSIVIPARNAASTIAAQISALTRQSVSDFEVVLVDNASTDRTVDVARAAAGNLRLRVVHEPTPGINTARNTGVAVATNDIVLVCDADDVVDENWVERMSDALRPGHWVYGAIDRQLLNSPNDVEIRSHLVEVHSIDYLRALGGNCGFFTSDWEHVGTFDERLSGHGDETEFFRRLSLSGVTGLFVPDAIVHYRLRSGVRAFLRDRYREGVGHRRLTDLGLENGLIEPRSRARLIARLLAHVALLAVSWPSRLLLVRRLGTISYYLGRIQPTRRRRSTSTR